MRIFEKPSHPFTCPICNTSKDAPITLIKVADICTDKRYEAVQIHVECIDLILADHFEDKILYQVFNNSRR